MNKRKVWISILSLVLIISFFIPMVDVWEFNGDIVSYSLYKVCIRDEVLPITLFPTFISIALYLYNINKETISKIVLSLLLVTSFIPTMFSALILIKAINGDKIYDGIAHFNGGILIYFTLPVICLIIYLISNHKK